MKIELIKLTLYTAAYIMSITLGEAGYPVPSGLCLISAAVFLYLFDYVRTQETLTLRGLLALGLLGGEGIARFQLSHLSTDWTLETWLSFYFFYFIFDLSAHILEDQRNERKHTQPEEERIARLKEARFQTSLCDIHYFRCVLFAFLVISWTAFIFEAWKLGFVPLFTVDTPHAYSYFHVKGIHYFTTLVVLTPSVSMLYLDARRKRNLRPDVLAILGLMLPIILTILLVSRFQFLLDVILAVFTGLLSGRHYKLWQLLLLIGMMITAYVFITIERAHSVEYLNGIFEMKNPATPIFITQPYMYIANNYDNFNVMTRELTNHSHGLRMLYPFVTLSGLKFFLPSLAEGFPLFVTKEELTTVTMLYDAWYDFGILGIAGFAIVLGLATGHVATARRNDQNPFSILLYAQLAFYYMFSFFTTWFSNPATWFYLGISLTLYAGYRFNVRKRRHE